MQFQTCFLCLLAFDGILVANANNLEVTPVQKVVSLLEGMLEKGKKEKHAEQVEFAASEQFCSDTEDQKTVAIKEEKEKIAGLAAQIEKNSADVARLTKNIAQLEKDISTWEGDIKAATKVRGIEKADYDTLHQDQSESIDALGRAIATLKKQTHDRKQSSLIQVSHLQGLSLIPEDAKKTIEMFLQQGDEDTAEGLAVSAPESNAYEFQSNGVVEMLSKLLSKFTDERTQLEKEEANSKHAFQMLMQDLNAQIDEADKDKTAASSSKAKRLSSKADNSGDMKATQKLQSADEKYLSDLQASCATKKSDFESRQQLRSEEIEAIEKAIEIISGGAVAGNADKHLPGFVQKQSVSLGQLRSSLNTQMQAAASQFLQARATKLNSRVLRAVAAHTIGSPFGKVKKMVKDMVVKLMEEANDEAGHKGWCDTELSTNAQTRKEKTNSVETLNAEIESLEASISKLTEELSDLSKDIAELDAAMASATKLRNEEKAENKATVADAQEAQTAVAQALTVLKEFYAKAAEATSFAQVAAPYNGMQSENGGVVAMLEVIESDFARLESETSASESSGQKQYDSFMTDSKVDKADKDAAVEHKTAKKQDEEQALNEKKNDLEGTQKELDAALAYFDKLKPSCIDSGVSYEDRVAKRKEEIESLQESLKIMNGEDLA